MSTPDSFAGAILAGRDPARAQVPRTSTRVELNELERWAEPQTSTSAIPSVKRGLVEV